SATAEPNPSTSLARTSFRPPSTSFRPGSPRRRRRREDVGLLSTLALVPRDGGGRAELGRSRRHHRRLDGERRARHRRGDDPAPALAPRAGRGGRRYGEQRRGRHLRRVLPAAVGLLTGDLARPPAGRDPNPCGPALL